MLYDDSLRKPLASRNCTVRAYWTFPGTRRSASDLMIDPFRCVGGAFQRSARSLLEVPMPCSSCVVPAPSVQVYSCRGFRGSSFCEQTWCLPPRQQ